ncbi:glycosyltransferase [Microbacterium protaetiae]|uniref:Glycosyltransferase n=1 Tax=Microbacterium protaetiae TaxID=2509458 RepID=A0A4P6EEA0_9MICO|nr:glycosyltransferase [Microbacterium protaetiae]QAY60622.1 glycosyltransferase [Microbacterium protaetiae]
MNIRVSVVVPVYNPGGYVEPLLNSLDRQTLPVDEFEAIFVDDGSTDGTADVLDEWASTRPHVRVIHQENHGWPGQPRNVGIDRARGTYVQFVDQDDWLGDEALERLTAYGDANGSDVVVGKMKGIRRSVPTTIFTRSYPRAEIGVAPVQDSQTPHKMFRRSFLDAIGLRFPEGKRRLEDHLFVTTAYLRADVISVYSDYDCYFHISRDDGGNAGFRSYSPTDYYRNLEDVLDVIDEYLPSGPKKDKFLERWIRTELVGRLRHRSIRQLPRERRSAFFTEISRILRDRIPDSAIRAAHMPLRLPAAIARVATMDEFYRLDAAMQDSFVTASVQGVGVHLALHPRWRALPDGARASQLVARLRAARHVVDTVAALLDDHTDLLAVTATYHAPTGAHFAAVRPRGSLVYSINDTAAQLGDGRVSVHTAVGPHEASLSPHARRREYARVAQRRLRKAASTVLVHAIGVRATRALGKKLRRRRKRP